MDKIINAIGAQADKIGVSLTETGGHFTAFNSLMAKLQTEQDKQVADSGQATVRNESCYRNTTSPLLTQVVL